MPDWLSLVVAQGGFIETLTVWLCNPEEVAPPDCREGLKWWVIVGILIPCAVFINIVKIWRSQ